MVQRRCSSRFSDESALTFGIDDRVMAEYLDGHLALEMQVMREVNVSHTTCANERVDPVVAEHLANHGE